ncbi:MAG TPA: FGGY-family carbohydrate kinase, partial [Actinomycetota bacterium]
IPVSVFPQVRRAGDPIGTVSSEAAQWSGLRAGIPVTLAGHDHLAGAVGAGALPSDLVNSVGTAETVLRKLDALPDLARAAELRAAVSVLPGAGGWSVMTGAARAGVVLGRAAAALGRTLPELDRLAAEAEPVRTLEVDDAGRLVAALQDQPDAPLPSAEPGAIWRGLLEALSRRTFEAASRLEVLAGAGSRVLVFGGGSRSRPWMDAKARLSPLPVALPRVGEAAGRGAALFAGVAAGWWPAVEAAPAPAADPVGRP